MIQLMMNDDIAYFSVRWKTSLPHQTKNYKKLR